MEPIAPRQVGAERNLAARLPLRRVCIEGAGMTTVTMNLMTGLAEGKVTARMACPHGTDQMEVGAIGDPQAMAEGMARLVAAHHESFGCGCEVGLLINGEDPVQ
jgi:hypothetical protein